MNKTVRTFLVPKKIIKDNGTSGEFDVELTLFKAVKKADGTWVVVDEKKDGHSTA